MIVYKITNKINDKIYIGKTIKSLDERFKEHCKLSKINCRSPFHKAIKKYGKENFICEIIFNWLNDQELNEMEKYFICNYSKQNNLYNISIGGDGGNIIGIHPNKNEIVKKISISNKGKHSVFGNKNPNYKKISNDIINKIIFEYVNEFKTIKELIIQFNLDGRIIKRILNENNIQIRSFSEVVNSNVDLRKRMSESAKSRLR